MRKILLTCAALFAMAWMCGTTWYVNPGAGGANNGTSQGDAWESADSADFYWGAGDSILFLGGETTSTAIAWSNAVGQGAAKNPLWLIGVNSSWVDDGTKYLISGGASATNCLTYTQLDYTVLKNFEFTDATGDGLLLIVGASRSSYNYFWNLYAHDNGGAGIDHGGSGNRANIFDQISSINNTGEGIDGWADGEYAPIMYDSEIAGCGSHPINGPIGPITRTVFYDNTTAIAPFGNPNFWAFDGCVFDGGSFSDRGGSGLLHLRNCKLTNGPADNFDATFSHVWAINNYYDTASIYDRVVDLGGSTTAGEANYADTANNNYGATDSSALRRFERNIGANGTSLYYGTAGLPPADTAGGGGGGGAFFFPYIMRHGN